MTRHVLGVTFEEARRIARDGTPELPKGAGGRCSTCGADHRFPLEFWPVEEATEHLRAKEVTPWSA